jgi:NAD(P)-dependent dehydrogenase (short-subunit alcohol dehydrogenase family)
MQIRNSLLNGPLGFGAASLGNIAATVDGNESVERGLSPLFQEVKYESEEFTYVVHYRLFKWFGRELTKVVLARGYRAVVTARNVKQVQDLVAGYEDRTQVLRLDVTRPAQVAESVRNAQEHFGGIDVLVNNAGIGYFAAVEESDDKDIRRMFEIDFFGLARVIHTVLPGMRKRRRGHIINMSSVAGLAPFPSLGYYCAAKFAVEGLSECLAMEVGPLGIKVTLVEPSGFRTDWAGRSAIEVSSKSPTTTRPPAPSVASCANKAASSRATRFRAAKAIIQVVEAPNPPQHLLLGKEALRLGVRSSTPCAATSTPGKTSRSGPTFLPVRRSRWLENTLQRGHLIMEAHMAIDQNKPESNLSRRACTQNWGSGSDHRIDGFCNA